MSKCEQTDCERPAAYRVHWPGKSLDCCEEHRKAARSLADAMGFALQDSEIEPCARGDSGVIGATERRYRELLRKIRDDIDGVLGKER